MGAQQHQRPPTRTSCQYMAMLQRTTCRTQLVQAGSTAPRSQSKRRNYLRCWHRPLVCWLIHGPNRSSMIIFPVIADAAWSITTTQPEERTSCGGTIHTRSLKSMPKSRPPGYVASGCGPRTQQGVTLSLHKVCGMWCRPQNDNRVVTSLSQFPLTTQCRASKTTLF